MSTAVSIGVLIVGAVLLLLALLSALFKGVGETLPLLAGRISQLAVGILGAALLAWIIDFAPPWNSLGPEQAAAITSTVEQATSSPANSEPSAPTPSNGSAAPDVMASAAATFSDCAAPAAPVFVPDGARAARDQMVAAQASVKAFDAATNAYTQCLDQAGERLIEHFKSVASDSDLRNIKALQAQINNAAIDTDQAVADKFNKQIRAFNAKLQHH